MFPYFTGVLGDGIGLRGAFAVFPMAFVIQIAMLQAAWRRIVSSRPLSPFLP